MGANRAEEGLKAGHGARARVYWNHRVRIGKGEKGGYPSVAYRKAFENKELVG